jgi:hypothetical protein
MQICSTGRPRRSDVDRCGWIYPQLLKRKRREEDRALASRAAISGWSGTVLYGDASGPGTLHSAAAVREQQKRRSHHAGGADPQPGRRGQRRCRSRRSPSVARCRRRSSSLVSSRSSLSPTSRNVRSTTAPRPRVIIAMASTSPVNPPTRTAQIEPATTSAAADPNARTRGRGATTPRYRFIGWPRGADPIMPHPAFAPRCRTSSTIGWGALAGEPASNGGWGSYSMDS